MAVKGKSPLFACSAGPLTNIINFIEPHSDQSERSIDICVFHKPGLDMMDNLSNSRSLSGETASIEVLCVWSSGQFEGHFEHMASSRDWIRGLLLQIAPFNSPSNGQSRRHLPDSAQACSTWLGWLTNDQMTTSWTFSRMIVCPRSTNYTSSHNDLV